MKHRDRPHQNMRSAASQWRRARAALLVCACVTMVLVRGSPLLSLVGPARGGGGKTADALFTTATAAPGLSPHPAALCGACPTRAVTDPGEPARAMDNEGADHPTIWLTSTLGTGRT